MSVSAGSVQELRTKTGAGIMDCKKALAESEGDVEKAIEYLRKKGLSAAANKAGRVAAEGMVNSYIHAGGKIGVLIEVNCETDFVARNEDFQGFVKDVAMHIAAANPRYVAREEVPANEVEKEKEILKAQVIEQGKPANMADKIVEGRLDKFYKENCLLEQPFVRDPDKTLQEILTNLISKIGEKIAVRRFVRFQLGEGIAKRQDDFATEVAKIAAGN